MTINRNLIVQAFPNQPQMQAAFESLVADADDAVSRLNDALTAITGLSGGAEGIVAQLAQKQPKSATLSAVAQLPTDPGVLEQIQPGIVSIRAIDTADTASLLTRALADTRYLGGAHGAASAAKLTTARSIAMSGDVVWSVTFDGSSNVTAAGTIQANAVTFSKFVAATQKALVGANAAGNFQEITLGTGISLVAGVLSATGTGGSVTSVSVVTANGVSGTVATPSTTPAITLTLGAITPSSVAATGTVTGSNLSGTNTGDQTSVSGNAGTATKLATGRTIAMTGDVTWTSPAFDGSGNVTAAATVVKINGVALSGLATGILKNTTTTGVPSIAVAADFPTLNQSTTGSAATLTTSRNIDGQAFNGSADITVIAPGTHAATSKATPVDADELPLVDSAASNVLKRLTWANLKATLKTYLDTLYQPLAAVLTSWAAVTRAAGFDTFAATPSSANLITLITDETGTGALVFGTTPTIATPVINGLATGTGVAATSTASVLVARDANKNILANNFLADYTTTATAAGTTTLTVASTYLQFFTGTTTQTVTLPVASTLALGQQFQIVNNSTGAVTVNSSGANAVIVLAGGTAATLTCILTSGTTAASWSASYWADAVTSGKKLTITGSYTQATSFPASPATDDLCYRTDRRIEYYWDGTRWLSTQLLYVSIPNTDFLLPRTATTLGMCRTANPFAALYAIYVVDAVFHNFITATSTWTLAIIDNDASVATTLATRSTSGDAINTHLSNRVTVNAVVASTVDNLQGEATLVSGTASLYCSFGLTYRLIG